MAVGYRGRVFHGWHQASYFEPPEASDERGARNPQLHACNKGLEFIVRGIMGFWNTGLVHAVLATDGLAICESQ